ncbi:excalibur calcium-binding domain-containing protein [Paenibacillus glycanilyticus]|uniref:excalibur calcium-binding domain-containing protein n=1 Tax=Paenibacillus glycanilyticus TaxID=126569 RepID=UPI0020421022|nr:excalibur calcium-binding domain-containing protein [Paenibacillus glycanilyticus]MCM3626292.1 excalibur calcium-binding domain-containing protein [Paenibacillus glycanilyticus]
MTKKVIPILLTASLVFGGSLSASAAEKVKTYKNCTALNKDYPGGVAKDAKVKNKGGKTKHKPFVSKELYEANKKSDRDKDGIACEK